MIIKIIFLIISAIMLSVGIYARKHASNVGDFVLEADPFTPANCLCPCNFTFFIVVS